MTTNISNDPMKNAKKIMSAVEGMVQILAPLESEERKQVIQGALVILREPASFGPGKAEEESKEQVGEVAASSTKAKAWMKQNGITNEMLEYVFDITDDAVTIIASEIPGKANAEKSVNSYILAGLASFMKAGDPSFSDTDGRTLCETLGCYDSNHSKYIKDKGNNFTGSKSAGWKLTAPGLKNGAAIVKAIAGSSDAN